MEAGDGEELWVGLGPMGLPLSQEHLLPVSRLPVLCAASLGTSPQPSDPALDPHALSAGGHGYLPAELPPGLWQAEDRAAGNNTSDGNNTPGGSVHGHL